MDKCRHNIVLKLIPAKTIKLKTGEIIEVKREPYVEKQNLEIIKTMDFVNKSLYGQHLLADDDEYEKVYTWFQFWANIIMYGEVKNV